MGDGRWERREMGEVRENGGEDYDLVEIFSPFSLLSSPLLSPTGQEVNGR